MRREVDVLLIFPPASAYLPGDPWGKYLLQLSPPTGLMYLAAYLRLHRFSVAILDGAVMSASGISLKAAITQYSPQVVGISAVTINANNIHKVAAYVKEQHPLCKIVCGGPHPTFQYEEMLSGAEIDAVVLKEGEETLLELVRYFVEGEGDLGSINGIAFKRADEIVLTPEREFIEDLDSLPFPARDLVSLASYSVPGTIITSRGCPFECIFCAAGPLSGRRNRMRSPENVVNELWDAGERYDLKSWFFGDDCFSINTARCQELCQKIQQLPWPIKWTCEGRVDTISKDLLYSMKEAGCVGIQYGVESGSAEVLKKIRKNIGPEQVIQAVKWAVDLGIRAACSFQIGLPYDTEATIMETMKFAKQLRRLAKDKDPSLVTTDFAVTTPLPGTSLVENAEKHGVSIRTRDWDQYTFIDPVMDTKQLTAEQISEYVAAVTGSNIRSEAKV